MDYDHFQAMLGEFSTKFNAAEWHALLCGLLCAGRPASADVWYELASQMSDDGVPLTTELHNDLERVYSQTWRQLNSDEDMSFELMLPDEDDELKNRAIALSLWCHAFLYGLSVGGVSDETDLPEDSAELLKDLAEISKVEFDDVANDEDEYNYAELVEYIRVGVLLVNEELSPIKPAGDSLH